MIYIPLLVSNILVAIGAWHFGVYCTMRYLKKQVESILEEMDIEV